MSFSQYLKDTQAELHHVAWPTRAQTIQYTVLVVAVSVFVSFYLGFFDFLFTTSLARALSYLPAKNAPELTFTPVTSTSSLPTPATSTINTGTTSPFIKK